MQPKNETHGNLLQVNGIAITVRGPLDQDVSGQASSGLCKITEGVQVTPLSKPLVAGSVGYTDRDMRTQHPVLDNGLVCGMQDFGSGMGGMIPTNIFKSMWQSSALLEPRITTGALPSVDAPMPQQASKQTPINMPRTGCQVLKPGYGKPYTCREYGMNKPLHGDPYAEKGYKWQDSKNMLTAASSYVQGLLGQIQGLIGGIPLSLGNTFKNLSNTQVQQIQSSTPPEVFETIVSHMQTTVDVGDINSVNFEGAKVHPETFANNMVILFSSCKNYTDVIHAMQKLKTDPVLQGKDKIETKKYTIKGMHGPNIINVDGYGNVTIESSSEAANAEIEFNNYLTSNASIENTVAAFYGTINSNVLTVSTMLFGNVVTGSANTVKGLDVADNTYVVSYDTGRGAEGTYIVNQTSITYPNVYMRIVNKTQKANNANTTPGGGGGGMPIGMIPGVNFFGEAAQLIQEMLPTIRPDVAAALKQQMLTKGPGIHAQNAMQVWKGFIKVIPGTDPAGPKVTST